MATTGSLVGAVLCARGDALAVGGVKANIGHAEPAAGMTGLLKLVLGLHDCKAVSKAQLRFLNPQTRDVDCSLADLESTLQILEIMAGECNRGQIQVIEQLRKAIARVKEGDSIPNAIQTTWGDRDVAARVLPLRRGPAEPDQRLDHPCVDQRVVARVEDEPVREDLRAVPLRARVRVGRELEDGGDHVRVVQHHRPRRLRRGEGAAT